MAFILPIWSILFSNNTKSYLISLYLRGLLLRRRFGYLTWDGILDWPVTVLLVFLTWRNIASFVPQFWRYSSIFFCHKCVGPRLTFHQSGQGFISQTLSSEVWWASAEQKAIQHCWGHSWSSSTFIALLVSVKAHSSQVQFWIRATESESTKRMLKFFIAKYLISILPKGGTSLSVHSFFSLFACCPI